MASVNLSVGTFNGFELWRETTRYPWSAMPIRPYLCIGFSCLGLVGMMTHRFWQDDSRAQLVRTLVQAAPWILLAALLAISFVTGPDE